MFGRRNDTGTRRSFTARPAGGASNAGRPSPFSKKERAGMIARRASAKQASAPGKKRPSLFADTDWGRVRLWVVGVVFSLLFAVLWARAGYLQIVMGPEYAEMARRQHTTRELVSGGRGNIVDRNGNILAKSVDCSSVWADPLLVRDKQATAAALGKALGLSPGKILPLLREKKRFVWIARKLDYQTAEIVRALRLPGIALQTESERAYPYRHLAGQLLGFVNIDDKGLEGLEKSFEGTLAGRSETRLVERDAAGRRLASRDAADVASLRGKDLRLTLDLHVQFIAEEALKESVDKYGARWGGCLVVDVPTGDILAWAQYPFFDPNTVQSTPLADRRNRLAMDMLEQGSTIKSFLVAAALEEKVVEPSTRIDCEKGVWKLRDTVLHDTHPYGALSVDKILHVSSNIGAAKIGLKLGAGAYRDYLTRLGFGNHTGLPLLGEARGMLRTGRRWSEVALANASFGQGFSATLAQMAKAYLCIAGNGEKRPLRLTLDREDDAPSAAAVAAVNGGVGVAHAATGAGGTGGAGSPSPVDRVFSEQTVRRVRAMMREVVEEDGGTGKAARIPGIDVGGKTGTAQKAAKTGGYGKERVGSFVGMLPIDNPRYLILVLLDEPSMVQYGGVIAAPVFKNVALNTLAYNGQLPDTDDPQVVEAVRRAEERKQGKSAARAAKSAKTAPEGRNEVDLALEDIARKMREPSRPSPADGKRPATSTTGAASENRQASGLVPSVLGLGMRSAVEAFAAEGVVPVIKGRGDIVVRQVPEGGRPWPEEARECVLWLEEHKS